MWLIPIGAAVTVTEKRKMINGRVGESAAKQAARILKKDGLSMSEYIRNSVDYVVQTGTVPPSGFPLPKKKTLDTCVHEDLLRFEKVPMPGKEDFPGLDGEELVDAIRRERYGY